MKRIFSKKFFLIPFLCFGFYANAQTLKEFINIALANNYQIRILKNEAQVSVNNNSLGNAGQLPTVNLNGAYSTTLSNIRQEFADGSVREGSNARNQNISLSILANWTLFNGFSVYARKNQLGYLEKLGELNSKFFIEQTISDIVLVYNQLVYENLLLDFYKKSLEISDFRLKLEQKRKEIGSGIALSYGQALVDFQSDKILLLNQENSIQSLKIELNRIIGNPLENEITISDNSFSLLTFQNKDELKKSIEEANSQLEQQRLQELIAETNLRILKTSRMPRIDLFAGYEYTKTFSEAGFFRANQNFGPTVGVSVNYNLFNGGNVSREIKNSKLFVENSNLSKEQVNQNIQADVLKSYGEHLSLFERINLAKNNVETMKKVYEIAAEQLKKGTINGYDFRLTQLTFLNSELSLLQLQLQAKAIEINLNRLSGKVLEVYMN